MFNTDLAREIWASKYRFKDETPIQTFERVARSLAAVEKNPDEWYEKFLSVLVRFNLDGVPIGLKCTPGGRITANIGTTYKKATMINCFSGDTQYFDWNRGVVSFSEMCGQKSLVFTKNGVESAEIRCFGVQNTCDYIFKPVRSQIHFTTQKEIYCPSSRSKFNVMVTATPDHRWILQDGSETEALKLGNIIESNVVLSPVNKTEYKKGFIHGLIYGDGSVSYVYTNAVNSMGHFGYVRYSIRLCGDKAQYKKFFKVKDIFYYPSNGGDPTCYVLSKKDLKGVPEYKKGNCEYIRGFIEGLIATDGNHWYQNREIYEISLSDEKAAEWLIEYAFVGGFLVKDYRIDSNMETNYGKTLRRITLSREKVKWKVTGVLENKEQEVFCAVVPGSRSFTLANGLYTGNCFISAPVSNAHVRYTRKTDNGLIEFPVEYSTSDNPDDLINIFLTIVEQAKTLASEGGYGLCFDFIRYRGSLIKGTGIKHPGVVAYMKIWDSVSQCIVQGAADGYVDKIKNYLNNEENFQKALDILKKAIRKGAMLASLSVDHPDCEEFIRSKQISGILTKFNISVLLTDEFLEAVVKDDFFDQKFDGKIVKRIKARDLYDLIMQSCYDRAEPGVLYAGNMMRNNPVAYLGQPKATNPCGEVPGLSTITTVCLLGSFNLTQYVKIGADGQPYFDYKEYIQDIPIFLRMLDNVNDLTYAPLPSYQWVIENLRQVGMGINGLGSTLAMLKIPYNSPEAVEFAKGVCELKENLTWQASALLAKEKGVFGAYRKEYFEATEFFNSSRITEETRKMLQEYGARNAKTTTVPPLGNSSLVANGTSNGIEPMFLIEYERKVICQQWPEGLDGDNVKSKLTRHKEKDYEYWRGFYNGKEYYYEPHNRGLCEINVVRDYGYQWLLDNYPDEDHSKYLLTTKDLQIEDHLAIQEVVQYYNNQSTSKTANLPNDYSFEDFKSLYLRAWKMGLNGFTTYRTDSMESVLSNISAKKHEIISQDIKLPDKFVNGPTQIIKREGKKFYLHFSYLPEDINLLFPICIWIYTNAKYAGESLRVCNKAARKLAKLALSCSVSKEIVSETVDKANEDYPHNRLGRLISLCLRHNVPREDILVSLMDIDGDNISTLLTAVRKFLSNTLTDGTELKGVKCPACGGRVIMEGGCQRCIDCPDFVGCG